MAKKEKLELDSFDFDRSLDMPEFSFDFEKPKDDGKPITKIGKAVAKGFFGRLMSADLIRRSVVDALPRGYGAAFDFADQSASAVKQLYDTAAKDLKPQLNELARVTGRLLPKDSGKDGLAVKQLRKFANSYENPNKRAEVDPREQNIAQVMGEVFQAQQHADASKEQREAVREGLRETISQARHRDVLGQLDAIRMAVTKSAAYTTTITANYQRKSLELQYRHYFLAMDMLVETKRANAEQKAYFEAIMRNTALPEQAKLAGSKDKSWSRNKFVGGALKGVFGQRADFMNNVRDSILKQLQAQIKSGVGAFQSGIMGADAALDQRDLMRDLGGGPGMGEMVGGMAGGWGADKFGKWLADKLRPEFAKHTGVRKLGNQLQYGHENMDSIAQGWAKSDTKRGGALGWLENLAKSTIRGMPGVDRGLQRDSIRSMQDPAVFDRSVAKSITDVIPGYLARILRELQVTRTGDEKTELLEYDLTKQKFNTKSGHRKNLMAELLPEDARKSTVEDIDALVKEIGGDSLTKEQRELLGRKLLGDNIKGLGGDKMRLMKTKTFAEGATAPHAEAFSRLFKKHFKGDKDNEKQYDFSTKFNSLGKYAPDQRELIQHLVNNGQEEFLQDVGALDEKGNVDIDALYQHFGTRAPKGKGKQKRAFADGGHVQGPGTGTSDSIRANLSNDEFVVKADVVRKPGMLDFLEAINENSESDDGKSFAKGGHVSKVRSATVDAIEKHSIKSEAVTIIELLDKINNRLARGVTTLGLTPDQYAALQKDDGRRTLGGHAKYYSDKLWTNAKAGLLRTFNAAQATGARLGNIVSRVTSYGKDKAKELWGKHGDKIKTTISKAWDDARGKLTQLQEVWIEGELKPRLLDYKLKSGQYIDMSTGKVIEKWNDIKGDIAEIGAPDVVVLYAGELKKAFIKTKYGKIAFAKLTGVKDYLKDNLLKGITKARSLGDAARIVGMNTLRKVVGATDGPADVYVKDNLRDPVLTKALMEAGHYFDRESKDPIRKVADIKGPVIDSDGDVRLTIEQIQKGLVDKEGKPFKSLSQALGSLAKNFFTGGLGLFNTLKDKAKGMFSGVGDFFKGFWGKDGIIFAGSKHIQHTLDDIYALLLERLPKGKNVRVGSVEDLRQKRKEKQNALEKTKERIAGTSGGWMGSAGGLFGKLMDRVKGKDKEEKEDEHGGLVDDLEQGAGQYLGEKVLEKGGKALKGAKTLAGKGVKGIAGLAGKGIGGVGKLAGKGLSLIPKGGNPALLSTVPTSAVAGKLAGARTVAGNVASSVMKSAGWAGGAAASGAGAIADTAKGVGTAAKAVGTGAKLTGKLGSKLIPGLGLAASAYGMYSAYDNLKQGNYGSAALEAATSGAGLALGGGGLAALGAYGSGLLAVLSAPVTLGALAVGAAGYGAYKAFKYATRNDMTSFMRARFAQYGFLPSQSDQAHLPFGLEEIIEPNIVWEGGVAGISRKGMDWKKCFDHFGVDMKDQEQVDNWTKWFVIRFKPVYLTALSALRMVKKDATSLSEVEKLGPAEKRKYFEISKFPGGPYDQLTSPVKDIPTLGAGPTEVKQALDEVQAELDKLPKEDKDGKGAGAASGAAAAATAAAGGAAMLLKDAAAKPGEGKPGTGLSITDSSGLKAAAAAAGKAVAVGGVLGGGAAAGVALTILGSGDAQGKGWSGRVDALSAIRFKAYGLKELDDDKVNALTRLEQIVAESVTFDSKKVAKFTGWPQLVFGRASAGFGITDTGGKSVENWNFWFTLRFLPTYLNYRTALYAATGKADADIVALKPKDAVNVAQAVITTSSNTTGGSTAVWQLPTSPWPAYELNAEAGTTDGNMKTLQAAAQSSALTEETAATNKASAANDAKKNDAGSSQAAAAPTSVWDKVKSSAKSVWEGATKAVGSAVSGAKDLAVKAGSAVSSAASGAWDAVKSAGEKVANSSIGKVVTAAAGKVKDALIAVMGGAGMTNPNEQAMFLAQMDHESGGFKALSENLHYKPETLRKVFPKYFKTDAEAQAAAAGGPEAIANIVYGGRMGNTAPGDGFKYRGRGVIQLTGKDNYARASKALGIDLVNNPDQASDLATAAKIALWYWRDRKGLSEAAQAGDVETATQKINGGQIGLQDRKSKFSAYLTEAKAGRLGGAAGGAPESGGSGDTASTIASATAPTDSGGGDTSTPSFDKTSATAPGSGKPTLPVGDSMPGGYLGQVQNSPAVDSSATGGFSNQAMNISAQSQSQAASSAGALDKVPNLLQQGNEIQTKLLEVVTRGFEALVSAKGQSADTGGKDSPSPTPSGKAPARGAAQGMPEPIVSMARKVFT